MQFLPERQAENTMLVNVMYHTKRDGGDNDYLDIIWKDLDTGQKFVETIPEPEMDLYFVKDEHRNFRHNLSHIELDKVEKRTCRFRDVNYFIGKDSPQLKAYIDQCKESGKWGAIKEVQKYQFVFGSDYDMENWTKIQWVLNNHTDREKPITKQYLDIETDSIDFDGFAKDGECDINAVTIVDEVTSKVFTFLLRNPKNPQIQDFEDRIDEFVAELHEDFDETYGDLDYNIYMYNHEEEGLMLIDLFKLINTLKRDFLMIWNGMGFDIPYIIARLKRLGLDPAKVMCHKDFKVQTLFFKKDTRNFMITGKSDYLKISSYTSYIDQMLNYAQLRKGGGEIRSYSLNAIAEKEVDDSKLDYGEDANMKTLAWRDYWRFVKYNIKDVLLQMGIERKTSDTENLYQRAYSNATIYNKVFKQTVFLKNRAYIEFFNQGFIIGNNVNIDYAMDYDQQARNAAANSDSDEEDEKFDGALVADPTLNSHTGIYVLGRRSMYVYDNGIDMDKKLSLYMVTCIEKLF